MWRTPKFWYQKDQHWPSILMPLSLCYEAASYIRTYWARPFKAPVPVICIGNCVIGGAGKTPVAIALVRHLKTRGHQPFFVTRGYGASLKGPTLVNPLSHSAREVGDEALLLASAAPTYVAADRSAGLKAAYRDGASLLLVDDGLQNPTFIKDVSLLVIDQQQALGNGRVFPAGPLREPLQQAIRRSQTILWMSPDNTPFPYDSCNRPVFQAALLPTTESAQTLLKQPIIAFCGIGFPPKFFASLTALGCNLLATYAFPDHHPYRAEEIERLKSQAHSHKARLVTTAKDWVRLSPDLRSGIDVLKVEAHISDIEKLVTYLESLI